MAAAAAAAVGCGLVVLAHAAAGERSVSETAEGLEAEDVIEVKDSADGEMNEFEGLFV